MNGAFRQARLSSRINSDAAIPARASVRSDPRHESCDAGPWWPPRIGPRVTRLVAAMLLAGLLGTGCATNPVTGYPILTLLSTKQEAELGEKAAQQLAQSIGLVPDAVLTDYVRAIGNRLANVSPRTDVAYTFHVVEMPEPTAFALPGGYVYVSRGALLLFNSEDELAGVLGHEIGHVAARHGVRRMTLEAPFALAGTIVASTAGLISPRLGRALSAVPRLVGSALLHLYSQRQENDADEIGVRLAALAGWNPGGLLSALRQLERGQELQAGAPRRAGFFDSHPRTPDRIERMKQVVRDTPWTAQPPVAPSHDAFLGKFEGLVVGPASAADQARPGNLFLHPDLAIALTFPGGWTLTSTQEGVEGTAADGTALIALTVVGAGNDPMEPLRAIEEEGHSKVLEKGRRLTIAARPAARLVLELPTKEGPVAVDFTWIAYRDTVYQIAGICPAQAYRKHEPLFTETAGTFRSVTAEERASTFVTRLRIVEARDGDTVESLAARINGAWSARQIAIANGLDDPAVPLAQGRLMKVTVREPYIGFGR